jgi:hypothetical protein
MIMRTRRIDESVLITQLPTPTRKVGDRTFIAGKEHVCVGCSRCKSLIWVRGEGAGTFGICTSCDPGITYNKEQGLPKYTSPRLDPLLKRSMTYNGDGDNA